jgi:hypothetical protein
MSRKSQLAVVVVILLVVFFSIWYLFLQRPSSLRNSSTQTVEISGAFAGSEAVAESADGLTLSRVVRGYFDSWTDPKDSQIFINAQANWPNEEPQLRQVFTLQPQTEYICWPSSFTTPDGTQALVKDTVYLVDMNSKLYLEGQKRVSYEEAMQQFTQGSPVIIALQEAYAANKNNIAFQVVMVGCQ